jgi:hypothetical protein
MPWEEIMEVAHSSGAAVAVDAAARIPPASNLSYYSKAGADAVIFSGGKHMRGPQTSGLLVARREIIAAARLNGSPNEEAICRPMKVSKEGVVAFVAALRAFLAEEDGSAVGARCDPYSHAVQIRMLVAAGRKVVGGGGGRLGSVIAGRCDGRREARWTASRRRWSACALLSRRWRGWWVPGASAQGTRRSSPTTSRECWPVGVWVETY